MAAPKAVRYSLVGLAILVVVILGLVVVLTRTGPGVERAGRFALDRIRGSINGELEVGRITSGGLLRGLTLHDVSITGPDGRAFVAADSARLAYRLRTLLTGSVVFDRLLVYQPDVVIERLPGQEQWNYERIFPSDTTAPQDTTRSLVLIRDATIEGGRLTVRLPWEPDGPVVPDDTARLILEDVPGGLVRVIRFEDLEGRVPRVVWEAPQEEGKIIEIGSLATRAYVWETPAEIEALEGVVAIQDSLISFEAPSARLPSSRMSLVGQIILGRDGAENEYDIEVDGQELALRDLQWLYPRLPSQGGGSLLFRMQTRAPGSMLWLAREARIRTGGTELAGSFGVVTGDTLYFTDVDLQASPLDLELIRQLVPAEIPVDGLLIGTVEVEGPVSSLETRGDLRFRTFLEGEGAESTIRWAGTIDARRPFGARSLEAELGEVALEQVAQFAPQLRLRGRATGRLEASGSLERGLDVSGDLSLLRDDRRSAVRGSGRFSVGGDRSAFDLRFDAEPVALELLQEQFPGIGRLAGEARGPITLRGTPDALVVDADLLTPAGAVVVNAHLDLTRPAPHYRAEGSVADFQLHRVFRDLPETVVTARFGVDAEGTELATLDGELAAELQSARVEAVDIHRGLVRATARDGLVTIDTLALSTRVGELDASGDFGLVAGRSGTLAVRLIADSLVHLEPVVFGPGPDPLVLGTSAFPLQSPELGAAAVRLGGEVAGEGRVTGSLEDWRVEGRVLADGLLYDQNRLRHGEADVAWTARDLRIDARLDSVQVGTRLVAGAVGTLVWRGDGGDLVARVRGPAAEELEIEGEVRRSARATELRLQKLLLSTGPAEWALTETASARFSARGVSVAGLTLVRAPDSASIRVRGALPWQTEAVAIDSLPATLEILLDRVRMGELIRLAQADTVMGGVLSGELRLGGTARNPTAEGRLSARPFRYGGAVLDSAGGDLAYQDRLVRTRFAGWDGGSVVVSGIGSIPADLALTPVDGRRLDRELSVRFRADSIPAGLVSFLAPGFEEVDGIVDGELAIVGTTRTPSLEGRLQLIDGSAWLRPLRVRYQDMDVTASMGEGRLIEIDGRLATRNGSARVVGTLDVTEPGDPVFALDVRANRLDASGRRDVSAVATGQVRLEGRYTRPVISGNVVVTRGEMNLDEIWRQYQIVRIDPSLFQLFGEEVPTFEPPREIPFLENMRLTGLTITTERDFWLRSQELNVEVAGELGVEADRRIGDLRLTGSLRAIDGNYDLQLVQGVPGRLFDIREGSIEFAGTPGIDPALDISAGYRVRRARGDPIDVVASVTGTLRDPRVSLSSDSDLPLSESDLASYIIFGRSGSELTQAEEDILSVGGLGTAGLGFARPMFTGIVSSELQRALGGVLGIDYIALSTPEYDWSYYSQEAGLAGVFHNTQVEVGIDAGPNLSLVGSMRLPAQGPTADGTQGWPWNPSFGTRVEWRLTRTWTLEGFVEDRFARLPSFGFSEIDDRKVGGLSIVRDWGY